MTDADKSRDLEEIIEILEAQVESLELELSYKERKMKEVQQELWDTNQELCSTINSKQLTFTQAEDLAKDFLATEKPLNDALVELLTAIYNIPIKLDDLAQADRFCFTTELVSSQNHGPLH